MASLLPFYGLLASSAFVTSVLGTPSVDIAYCASINTASTSSNTSIYQSDGLCHDFCSDSYAYAVVSGTECWCSDYTPSSSDQVDTSKCDASCAGYPSDWCAGDGLYAYMALSKDPSGTAGASSAATSSAADATSSAKKTTATTSTTTTSSSSTTSSSLPTSTSSTPIPTTTSTTPTTTSTSSSTTFSTSTLSISKTTTTSTTPLVQTVTAAGGIVQTVTVTPSSSSDADSSKSHKSVSTGAAVGIAIGVVAGVVLGVLAVFLIWRRKRREREAIYAEHNSKANSPRGVTPSGSPKVSEVSAGGPFTDTSGRRRSALMPIDPRIDPAFSGIYARTGDNKSRDSVNSLRDDHDYSRRVHQPERVLRATNPDPDPE